MGADGPLGTIRFLSVLNFHLMIAGIARAPEYLRGEGDDVDQSVYLYQIGPRMTVRRRMTGR